MELPQLLPGCSDSPSVSSCHRCHSTAPTTNFMCSKCFRERAILKTFQPPLSFNSKDENFFAEQALWGENNSVQGCVSPSRGRGADPEITSKTPLTTPLSRHSPGTSLQRPRPRGRVRGPGGHFRDPLRDISFGAPCHDITQGTPSGRSQERPARSL